MKCTKCGGEIEEKDGYVTIHSSFEAIYSFRDCSGVLVNKTVGKDSKTTRTCKDCVNSSHKPV